LSGDGKPPPPRSTAARIAEFATTARRLLQEREATREIVAAVLRDTPRNEWSELASRIELQSSGVLEHLSHEVEKQLDRDPPAALAIAELSTSIADAIPPDSYPAITLTQLRAHAWKDRGQALSYLGRYDDALRALDIAEELLDAFGTLAHDRAIVRFVRGVVLQHLRKFTEAQTILEECSRVFRAHDDRTLGAKCTLAIGNLLVRRGDDRGARDLLTPLIDADPSIAPLARMALGWCAVHLGDAAEAVQHFAEAAAAYARLGRDLEHVRARYGAASAMLRLGRFRDAMSALQVTRETFLACGLIEEGGLSGLGIVEAQLVLGDATAARALAAALVREFTDAGLNRRAVAALAYLNDAIAASSATPEVVRDVHAYLFALRSDPTREFDRATGPN
jgi:tetratricopeptide (TPR) repeat protein